MKVFCAPRNSTNRALKQSHFAHLFVRLVKQGVFAALIVFAILCASNPANAQTIPLIPAGTTGQATQTSVVWLMAYKAPGWEVFYSGGSYPIATNVSPGASPNVWSCSNSGQVQVPANVSGRYVAYVTTGVTRVVYPEFPTLVSYEMLIFTFDAIKLNITCNGAALNSTTPVNVIVGQQVQLSANVAGKPAGATETGNQWTIGGEKVKSYRQTAS